MRSALCFSISNVQRRNQICYSSFNMTAKYHYSMDLCMFASDNAYWFLNVLYPHKLNGLVREFKLIKQINLSGRFTMFPIKIILNH